MNSARRRRARHRVLAAITGAVLLAAMGTYLWINRPVAAPPVLPWEDAMSVQAEQVEGGSRLRIHCDRGEPHTFAYLLLLGPDGAWPLFPAPLVELANPLGPYPAPETGLPWPNEAATATEILALFAPHRVDRLEDRSYVRTLAARLRAARHDGESLADLLAELRHDLLPPAGRLLRLPIER